MDYEMKNDKKEKSLMEIVNEFSNISIDKHPILGLFYLDNISKQYPDLDLRSLYSSMGLALEKEKKKPEYDDPALWIYTKAVLDYCANKSYIGKKPDDGTLKPDPRGPAAAA
jgi:hypothetical protein